MKQNYFIITLLILTSGVINAQSKNGSKFFRPSMTNVVISSPGVGQPLVDEMKKIAPQSRFDNHSVNYSNVSVNFPKLEEELDKNSGNLKGAFKEIKAAQERHEKACQKALINELNPLCNQAIALWWSRDEQGNMSDDLIQQRGLNTASDADVIKDKASENSRLGELGYELISRSYFTVYELSRIRTMDEVYNDLDEKARKIAEKLKKPYNPIKRTEEGYVIDYNAYIVKIDWNDSVQSAFWEYLWVDRETNIDRASKIKYFKNTTFPMQYITEVSGTVTSTQSNDPSKYGAFRRRLSMQELLLKAAPDFQEDAMFKASKKVEDFRLRSPLFEIYPTTVKLGSKEGIYIDQRFFAYEYTIDKKGEKKAKRVGVLRPTKIVKNEGLANGQSEASKFKQQGGKKLYSGMFVEMKEDRGYSMSIGFIPGFYAAADINIARIWKKALKKSAPRILSGIRLGGYIGSNSQNFSNIEDYTLFQYSSDSLIINAFNVEGDDLGFFPKAKIAYAKTTSYGVTLGRECYPFKKGNFYLYPQIGISASTRTFTKVIDTNGISYDLGSASSEYKENPNELSKLSLSAALGLGYQLNPWISMTLTPTYISGGYTYGESLHATPTSVGGNPVSIYTGIRIKF